MTAVWWWDIARWILSAVGVVTSLGECWDTRVDYLTLVRANLDGARLVVAKTNMTNEALRAIVQVLFLLMATLTLIWPPEYTPAYLFGANGWLPFLNRAAMIIATLCLTTKTLMDRSSRKTLLEFWVNAQRSEGPVERRKQATFSTKTPDAPIAPIAPKADV